MWWIRNHPLLRLSPVLLATVGALAIIQIALSFIPAGNSFTFDHLALSKEGITKGKLWTVLTYGAFHHPQHISHLIINALMILYYGGRICHMFSPHLALRIFSFGVLGGGGAHIIYSFLTNSNGVLIGASGGCFALLAATCIITGDSRFCGIKGRFLIPILCSLSIIFIFIHPHSPIPPFKSLYYAIASSPLKSLLYISHSCHLGGLIAGWIIAHQMIKIPRSYRKRKKE